jgi:hypothetical protein
MKKLLFVLLFTAMVFAGFSQKRYIPWLQSDTIVNTYDFIWRGDAIDFSKFGDVIDGVTVEDNYIKFYSGTDIIDSIYWDYYQDVDTLMIIGDSLLLKLTDSDMNYLPVGQFNSKMDTVVTDSTLTGLGTVASPLSIDSLILSSTMKTVYSIRLPSSTTVDGRITGAAEGTDYPTGWVLESGTNPVDLDVTHGMGRRVASVTVFSIDGTQEQQLFGNAAFSGIFTPDSNTLKISSLATIQKAIKIYILFE